jgi:hypothetical protein
MIRGREFPKPIDIATGDALKFKRERPAPREQIEFRARLSIPFGSTVLTCFAAHLVLLRAAKPIWPHKYFPSLPRTTSGPLCLDSTRP